MKGYCPVCGELMEITVGPKQNESNHTTSHWWRVVMHKSKNEEKVCGGSGKLI